MVFDRWPRKVTGDAQWHVSGDVPFDIELERPCDLSPGTHTLEVIVDGDLCVAVVDRQVSLSTRIYSLPGNRICVFAGDYYAVEFFTALGWADGAVRACIYHYTTDTEVDRLVEALIRMVSGAGR